MAFAAHSSERIREAQDVRLVVDAIPTLAWSAQGDGSADFFNQRWLEYTGLSTEQARDWGWTVALHPDDVNRLVDYWRSVLASGEPGEMEGRLRRFDGVYRWFLFRATPLFDNDGRVVKWFAAIPELAGQRTRSLLGTTAVRSPLLAGGPAWERIPGRFAELRNQVTKTGAATIERLDQLLQAVSIEFIC
jgi:PAS domain S-box-containing protein